MDRKKQTEGIVLRSLEYKERQRIITLFTKKSGLTTLIIKGLSPKKPHLMALSTPFCIAEFHYLTGRSEIHHFQDATLLNNLSSLRTSFAHLRAAGEMASSILSSQLPEKKTPSLYRLLKAYFLHLHAFPEPFLLSTSFQLKLLLHEGLLSLTRPPSLFTTQEWKTLLPLAVAKHFSVIPSTPLPSDLIEKLKSYSQSVIHR